MSLLLETIKCKDGKLYNLSFHNFRFNKARKELFNFAGEIDLNDIIKIEEKHKKGLFRCRVIYSENEIKTEFLPHSFRKIKSLKLVTDNNIDYHLKYHNREVLQQLFEKRGNCDDILIVKNGYITDSFAGNVVFFDGQNWWTPDTPLLEGTQRSSLLKQRKIKECKITPASLPKYLKIGLINAMQDFNEMPVIEIQNIYQ